LWALGVGLLALLGLREKVVLSASFDASLFGDDIDAYFEREEAKFSDIVEGVQKRVVWAGDVGSKTQVSVLYIHGFSATSEEIRPVPDKVAEALGANLLYTRLTGHRRSGAAMTQAIVGDWMRDTAEALAAVRAVGESVLVISTSMGGTLMGAAALLEDLMENVVGEIFVSPNFAINSASAVILTWPGVRWWGPLVGGAECSFVVSNGDHAAYWTNSCPTVALLPMAALVKVVDGLELGQAKIPALFVISDNDQGVSPTKTVKSQRNGAVQVSWRF